MSTQPHAEGKLLVLTPNFGATVAYAPHLRATPVLVSMASLSHVCSKRKEYKLFSKDANEISEWCAVMTRVRRLSGQDASVRASAAVGAE